MTAPSADASGAQPSMESAGERLREVARSGGISLAGAVVSSLLGFVLVVVVSRFLGAGGAGAFSVAVALAMTLTVVGRFGTDTAPIRTLPRLRHLGRDSDVRIAVRAALGPVAIGATALGVVLWLIAPWAAGLVLKGAPSGDGTRLLHAVAIAVPLGAVGYVALAATRGLATVVPMTVVENIIKPVSRCVLVASVLAAGGSIFGALVAWSIAAGIGAAMGIWMLRAALRGLRRRSDRRAPGRAPVAVRGDLPAARPDRRSAAAVATDGKRATQREIWTFAGPRAFAAVCEIAGLHAGLVITSALAGTEDAGVFNAVLRLALAGTLVMQALRFAVAPRISQLLAADDIAGVEHVHRASTIWVVLMSFPLYLACAGWPHHVLGLFGGEFRTGATALTLLSLAMLVNLATGNVATVLLMSGRSGLILGITATSLTLGIVLTIALAPTLGVLGAAVAKAVAVVFENVAVAAAVRHLIGVRPLSRPLIAAAGLGIACFGLPALAAYLVGAQTALVAGCLVLAGGVAYIVACWRWRSDFELAALRSLVPGWVVRRLPGARRPTRERTRS